MRASEEAVSPWVFEEDEREEATNRRERILSFYYNLVLIITSYYGTYTSTGTLLYIYPLVTYALNYSVLK